MIPVCFQQEVSLHGENNKPVKLLACAEAISTDGPFPIDRVYIVLGELLEQMRRDCKNSNIPLPVQLDNSILSSPQAPKKLMDCLRDKAEILPDNIRICLLNGAGGGLGDAIMFAPALKILYACLQKRGVRYCSLDIFSMLPDRARVIFNGLTGVTVKPLPLSLQEFFAYDVYSDFSDMLYDEVFKTSHMTDFALDRMGITPESIPASEKSPFLMLSANAPPELTQAVSKARSQAAGRPLVAVIFRSAYARTMPDSKAAAICEALSDDNYQPVILMNSVDDADEFIIKNVLSSTVIDLSAQSTDYLRYMLLVREMDAIVSVDTSAIHIGGALAKPTVAIFNSINHDFRVRYSSSVLALQINYQGRQCRAPCGLSKITSFVEGKLKSGRPLRLEFGHACDEAIDKERLLDEVIAEINQRESAGGADKYLKEIRAMALPKFSSPPAPCWENLKVKDVLNLLKKVIEK